VTDLEDAAEIDELVRHMRLFGTADDLVQKHTPDPDGRCPRCAAGGTSSGHQLGCTVYRAAVKAAKRRR
jgi:hypothetical protein